MAHSLLHLLSLVLFILPAAHSQPAPTASPSGPVNITGILEKAGGFSFFIQLLNQTQAADQINNQVNNSRDGMTVFAPTDNGFNNLASGTLNNLTSQQHVQLVQYHICPKYYSMNDLQTVSNPVRTQASGQDNKVFGLYFTARAGQLNVSTGIVTVPVYNAVSKDFPLAVYQVDQVLLPKEFYDNSTAPASAPPTAASPRGGSGANNASGATDGPSSPSGNGSGKIIMSKMGVMGVVIWCFCLLF